MEKLFNIYKEMVDENDGKGYADIYYNYGQHILKHISEKYNIKDVEWLDGYFIFGIGTNSVLHFHIVETPGWKYGIWFSAEQAPLEDAPNRIKVRAEAFTQYEANIDKFKPSASIMTANAYNYTENAGETFDFEDANFLYNIIDFIKEEPELAFCKDYHYWDYNEHYHSRAEAKREFRKWKREQAREQREENKVKGKLTHYIITHFSKILGTINIHYIKSISPSIWFLVEIKDYNLINQECDLDFDGATERNLEFFVDSAMGERFNAMAEKYKKYQDKICNRCHTWNGKMAYLEFRRDFCVRMLEDKVVLSDGE